MNRVSPGRVLAILLACAGLIFALATSWQFSQGSLQMDFSAFHAAANCLDAGLDPYANNITHDPGGARGLWDGIGLYRHSRFLYPPLVAWWLKPWGSLPYAVAKRLWSLLSVLLAVLLWALSVRLFQLPPFSTPALFAGALFAFSAPLTNLLERGQVDLVTGCLLVSAILVLQTTRPRIWLTGLFLGLAIFWKLHVALLLILLWLVGSKRVVGYTLAVLTGLCLWQALTPGPGLTREYLVDVLPRVLKYGEAGPAAWLLPPSALQLARQAQCSGLVWRQGKWYPATGLDFSANGSLTRALASHGPSFRGSAKLYGLLVLFLLGGFLAYAGRGRAPADDDAGRRISWLAAWCVVLLSAPLTWSMNLVWMAPAMVWLMREAWGGERSAHSRPRLLCLAAGVLLIACPDALPWLYAHCAMVADFKYVVGLLLVFAACCLFLLAPRPADRTESGS